MTENLKSVVPSSIESQMRESYLDYAMSVIVSRALPDCCDGMKPVHRKILYAMHEVRNYHDKPYKKSGRIVGDVMGKYHPHGDAAIYMSLVRMAQDFSLRVPLIDGQGNFGSVDGDSPAQMRYTEVRLAKIASKMLEDIDLATVDFQDNYDGSEREPKILPARFPNLLVNGASGIAVGMATNIPTHNLSEVIDACCALIKNPDISYEELLSYVPGPDFPTGGIILGAEEAKKALITGRGSVRIRGRATVEQIAKRDVIIISEIPYQVNKAELVKRIEELSKEKVVEGISEIRDESNKLGMRVVIELKATVVGDVVLNALYRHTQLQNSFSYNMLALNEGVPMLMNLRSAIEAFVIFREDVVRKRTQFLLTRERDRAHLLIGLSLAVANIDEVIVIIRSSKDAPEAGKRLLEKSWNVASVLPLLQLVDDYRNEIRNNSECFFTPEQVKAILEMRLSKLTGLEKNHIEAELNELGKRIVYFLEILSSSQKLHDIILSEFEEIKEKFATPRKTTIETTGFDLEDEDLIQKEEMIVITTLGGYIKRIPLNEYRAQKRGGKGKVAMSVYSDDETETIVATNTHTTLLFFSNKGQVYKLKVYKLPLCNTQSKGRAIVNLFPLAEGEKISTITQMPSDEDTDIYNIMFATAHGNVRRSSLGAFAKINAGGKIAIRLSGDDTLIAVKICLHDDHIMLNTKKGKSLRCSVSSMRVVKSRTSDGVRGIRLSDGDEVVSMFILQGNNFSSDAKSQYLRISVQDRIEIKESDMDESQIQQIIERDTSFTDGDAISVAEIKKLATEEEFIVVITENGYGKRTSSYEYRPTSRSGIGIASIESSQRNGAVVAAFTASDNDQIILMTDKGVAIRIRVADIRIIGRRTGGVILFNTKGDQKVICATHIPFDKIEEEDDLLVEVNDNTKDS